MKYTYRFHPGEYALGETERFYSDMEAKGWRLKKRGQYLSKFVRTEPSRARYRVEVFVPGFLENAMMPEEQLEVFADCGWEYVNSNNMLYVFRAPEGSDAPEFYMDPTQQAATLKVLRRQFVWPWLGILAVIALMLWMQVSLGRRGLSGELSRLGAELYKELVIHTGSFLVLVLAVLSLLVNGIQGAWAVGRTYRRLKRGVPLDHEARAGWWHRLFQPVMAVSFTLVMLLNLARILPIPDNRREMPVEPDGPYLVLRDLGWEGERTTNFYDRASSIEVSRSLLADHWDTAEYVDGDTPDSGTVWIYQDVYRLRIPGMAENFALAVMDDATFARSREVFTAVEVEGLDAAWISGDLEAVAVKDGLVAYLTYLPPDRHDTQGDSPLISALTALAERWSVYSS